MTHSLRCRKLGLSYPILSYPILKEDELSFGQFEKFLLRFVEECDQLKHTMLRLA
jgi:hypothetical protein